MTIIKIKTGNSNITKEQAFLAMYAFLDEYYEITKSDDIGGLLGSMSLLSDGTTADPAIKHDWDKALKKVLSEDVDAQLKLNGA